MKMIKLKQMYYGFKLERTRRAMVENAKWLNFENPDYNKNRLRQLDLMTEMSYLENKLSEI